MVLPSDIAGLLPKQRLLSEAEWRGLGVQQSRGWVHYAIHRPEPHIMLFRRPRVSQAALLRMFQSRQHGAWHRTDRCATHPQQLLTNATCRRGMAPHSRCKFQPRVTA